MSETAAICVTLTRIADNLEETSNALRSAVEIMLAHRVLDTERPTEPPPTDKSRNDNPL